MEFGCCPGITVSPRLTLLNKTSEIAVNSSFEFSYKIEMIDSNGASRKAYPDQSYDTWGSRIEIRINKINWTSVSSQGSLPQNLVIYEARDSSGANLGHLVLSFNVSTPYSGTYTLSVSFMDMVLPSRENETKLLKIQKKTLIIEVEVQRDQKEDVAVPESMSGAMTASESASGMISTISGLGALAGISPGAGPASFALTVKTVKRLKFMNLNTGGYISSFLSDGSKTKNSGKKVQNQQKISKKLKNLKKRKKNCSKKNHKKGKTSATTPSSLTKTSRSGSFQTATPTSSSQSQGLLASTTTTPDLLHRDRVVENEICSRGALSKDRLPLIFPLSILLKSLLYNISWMVKALLNLIVFFMQRKGTHTTSKWVFYGLRLHKKVHFAILVFVVSDLAFRCARTLLHSRMDLLDLRLRISRILAFFNILLMSWDLAVVLWESLRIRHDRRKEKYVRFMEGKLSLKEIAGLEDIEEECSARASPTSRRVTRAKILSSRPKKSHRTHQSFNHAPYDSKHPKKIQENQKLINIEKTLKIVDREIEIQEYIRYEVSNEPQVFSRLVIRLLAFSYLFKIFFYQILTIVSQNIPYMMIFFMIVYEAVQLSVQVFYYCSVKHLKYWSILVWRIIQSACMLVFLVLSVVIDLVGPQKGGNGSGGKNMNFGKLKLEKVAVAALMLSMVSEYVFLVLNVYYIIKMKYWECELKKKLERYGKKYMGFFDDILVYDELETTKDHHNHPISPSKKRQKIFTKQQLRVVSKAQNSESQRLDSIRKSHRSQQKEFWDHRSPPSKSMRYGQNSLGRFLGGRKRPRKVKKRVSYKKKYPARKLKAQIVEEKAERSLAVSTKINMNGSSEMSLRGRLGSNMSSLSGLSGVGGSNRRIWLFERNEANFENEGLSGQERRD